MTKDLWLQYRFLKEYLKNIYSTFNEDSIADLESQDFVFFQEIRNAETMFAKLKFEIFEKPTLQNPEKQSVFSIQTNGTPVSLQT